MSTRSGIPEIDAVIEAFLAQPLGDWTNADGTIADLADPEMAHGSCVEVTEQFVAFAKSHGLTRVYATNTNLDELGYEPKGAPHGEVLDPGGEIVPGFYHDHTVASFYLPDQVWPVTVDFTASQYGYTEHPLVLT